MKGPPLLRLRKNDNLMGYVLDDVCDELEAEGGWRVANHEIKDARAGGGGVNGQPSDLLLFSLSSRHLLGGGNGGDSNSSSVGGRSVSGSIFGSSILSILASSPQRRRQ